MSESLSQPVSQPFLSQTGSPHAHVESDSFQPHSTHVNADELHQFLSRPFTQELTEVPGIKEHNKQILQNLSASSDGKEANVETTSQLFACFLVSCIYF